MSAPTPDPMEECCPKCGAVNRPLLSPGTGPHACKASCAHCGRFWRWISLLAPSERIARKVKARLEAMRKHPPSQKQLELLRALGDQLASPQTMAEAHDRIDALRRKGVL